MLGALAGEEKKNRGFDLGSKHGRGKCGRVDARALDSEAMPSHLSSSPTVDDGIFGSLSRIGGKNLLYVLSNSSRRPGRQTSGYEQGGNVPHKSGYILGMRVTLDDGMGVDTSDTRTTDGSQESARGCVRRDGLRLQGDTKVELVPVDGWIAVLQVHVGLHLLGPEDRQNLGE